MSVKAGQAQDGLVKVSHYRSASRFCGVVVGVDVGDEDCKRLGAVTKLGGDLLAGICGVEHDPGIAQVHLGSAGRTWWSIPVVLGKAECGSRPV